VETTNTRSLEPVSNTIIGPATEPNNSIGQSVVEANIPPETESTDQSQAQAMFNLAAINQEPAQETNTSHKSLFEKLPDARLATQGMAELTEPEFFRVAEYASSAQAELIPRNTTESRNAADGTFRTGSKPKNETLAYIRKNYPSWFNWSTMILHTLGAMLPFVSIVPEKASKAVKEFAISFSRWGIPLVKMHTGLEALSGKRMYEAIARILPTLFIPILPFFNFHLAYGLSSGINVVLEHMNDRIGELSNKDSFKTNNAKVVNGFKSMLHDLVHGVHIKERTKLGLALGGAGAMITGAIPALLFARDSLNSWASKLFGSMRAVGGLMGDLSIILFSSKTDPAERQKEKLVGSLYLIPSMMDFMQRWITQSSDANEIFNHAKTALNTIAEVLWSSLSTDRNVKQNQTHTPSNRQQASLVSAAA